MVLWKSYNNFAFNRQNLLIIITYLIRHIYNVSSPNRASNMSYTALVSHLSTDLLYAETGDRIWWTWGKADVDSTFTIVDVEKCVSPAGGRPGIENEALGKHKRDF